MTGPELMRAPTILAEFSRNGAKVASVTAKDKLRQQLGKGMNIEGGSINFSSEKADTCNRREHGIENVLELVGLPLPDMCLFELPIDREGDVVVISDGETCIGTTPAAHDLSALGNHPLRTHGGLAESYVPFILNRPLNDAYAKRAAAGTLRNFHIFDFAINGVM
jgi:hypothetical protein